MTGGSCILKNQAPCSKLQGIKRNCAEANPPWLHELRRGRLAIPVKQEPLAEADHPCSPDGGSYAAPRQATGYSGEGE